MVVSYLPNVIPDETAFARLFETTGWNAAYKLTPAALHEAISNSWYVVSAVADNQLVGFGRMISDGIMHALILDMIVDPAFQGRGIGSRILEMMKAHADAHRVRDLQLFSAKGKEGFYRQHGFTSRPDTAPGMEIKRLIKETGDGS